MKIKLISALLIVTFSIGINAHVLASGPLFSQSFSNPLNLNPAYAGSLGHSRLAFAYRNQSPAIPGGYVFPSFSYDHYFPKLSSGLGFKYDYERQAEGYYTSKSYSAIYAFNFKIKELVIRPAINIGLKNETYDADRLTFGGPQPFYFEDGSKKYLNLGFGVLVAYKGFLAGASVDHITRPKANIKSADILFPQLITHVSYLIKCNKDLVLIPAIVYQYQDELNTFLPSLMLKYDYLKVGTAYRYLNEGFDSNSSYKSNNLVFMIGFVNKFMSIGYSHDYIFSKLASASGGAHEFSVVINFNCKKDKEKFGISQLYEF